ncbi:MAG: EAL domain-containing protein [Thioalkalispiraceae bacterium]|jgi:diguanylate cyclase (GGDEF)-like protein
MQSLKKFITSHSIRKQYVYLAILMAGVVFVYTWFTGAWIEKTGKTRVNNISTRIALADMTNRIRLSIIAADNTLELFLLSPGLEQRLQFESHLERADEQLDNLIKSSWAKNNDMLLTLHGLKSVLKNIQTAAGQIMEVRQTANLMYPAMRLANGDMLRANQQIMTETELALSIYHGKNLRKLPKHEIETMFMISEVRDTWLKTITAYRLFLINRMGYLYEGAVDNQVKDVELIYDEFEKKVEALSKLKKRKDLELEILIAIETIEELAPKWKQGFKQVVEINKNGQWRADIPLVTQVINPLFNEVYTKLAAIDDALKKFADADLVDQTEESSTVIKSLWGMSLFIMLLTLVSYIVLELNFIRPIAKVATSLKAEAKGHDVTELPDVKAEEIRDLTDAFIELRQQVHTRQLALEHIAMHDSLTSLPNRALLLDRLNQSILNTQRRKRSLALLMLDLDRFKEINDTLGHQTGDALLQQVGVRLRNVLRDSDTVARLGGDEFAVLLSNVNETNALRIAAAIHEQLEKVYNVYEHSLYVGASIGVAIFPQHGETAQTLLQHADVAMYVAKRSNSNIMLYDREQDEHSLSQLSVLSDLRGAIENEEFILEYQPKLTIDSAQIYGAEALIRWQHPKHGLIMPDEFIPAAEQTGLIKRISNWVLDTAIRDCQRLHSKGHKINVSINLSVWDIQDPNINLNITEKLEKWGLPAEYITLEITERVMMAEPERARQVLSNLDAMGLNVVIDDFGTGFSSLVYLKQLPVSMLKIDKSFVVDMMRDESDAAIVHSIIDLAHNLGLQVVAEGVESDQTWSWLKTWDCDHAQGYYISPPLALKDFEKYIESYSTANVFTHN